MIAYLATEWLSLLEGKANVTTGTPLKYIHSYLLSQHTKFLV